jgi:hypothetical protein
MKYFGVLGDGGAWILGLCSLKFHRADRVMAEVGLFTEATPRRLWFGPRPINVRFMVDKLAQKQLFSEHFSLPFHYHSMNDQYDHFKTNDFRTPGRTLGTLCKINTFSKESLRVSEYKGIVCRMLQNSSFFCFLKFFCFLLIHRKIHGNVCAIICT